MPSVCLRSKHEEDFTAGLEEVVCHVERFYGGDHVTKTSDIL